MKRETVSWQRLEDTADDVYYGINLPIIESSGYIGKECLLSVKPPRIMFGNPQLWVDFEDEFPFAVSERVNALLDCFSDSYGHVLAVGAFNDKHEPESQFRRYQLVAWAQKETYRDMEVLHVKRPKAMLQLRIEHEYMPYNRPYSRSNYEGPLSAPLEFSLKLSGSWSKAVNFLSKFGEFVYDAKLAELEPFNKPLHVDHSLRSRGWDYGDPELRCVRTNSLRIAMGVDNFWRASFEMVEPPKDWEE